MLSERLATLFAESLHAREAELRRLPDHEATLFVLRHALEAATHAAAFYREKTLSQERVLEALTELVTRTLLPVADAPPGVESR